ncbi:alpha/beta fold hydrolase [Pleomorphomonas sp. JP5]|uniref:alpha/beta fold hydrolase n=1 Tax=Pleomorphomonas sp. JP5 TaxID=2942998 RepID=UPI002044B7A9|nr:alpha/beta fold hydrolase [Pleomorphomonas sp. JP5]MCM5560034.1 alpha/beta hydrolase [Pleomorphomonas sp. JP5]
MTRFSTVDGEFAYIDKGSGQPVVFVHGFASNAHVNWLDTGWIDRLVQEGYRAIALDNRGHGDSVKLHDAADYRLEKMAGDVLALIDHLALPRVRAIGYSMGSRILLDFASRHSDRLEQLVLGGIGGTMAKAGLDREPIAAALLAPTLEDVADPVGRGYRQFAEQTRSDRQALAACIRGYGRPVETSETERIAVPTLVAVGTKDAVAGSATELAKMIPGADVLDIPNRDHMRSTGDKVFKEGVMTFFAR